MWRNAGIILPPLTLLIVGLIGYVVVVKLTTPSVQTLTATSSPTVSVTPVAASSSATSSPSASVTVTPEATASAQPTE